MKVSIVIPVYRSEETIGKLVDRLFEVLGGQDLEIVLVNDGSPDNSHRVCLELQARYARSLVYLNLARNFGEHNAVMAGLNYCSGDYVVIMDDDFQNPPETIMLLVQEAAGQELDVVYSRYDVKRHSFLRNLGSRFTNWVASFLLDKPRDLYLSSFKCISRFAVKEIIKYKGPFPYIDGLILRSISRIGVVFVPHEKRKYGRSGYTFRKLARLWLNMFVNFSVMPLRISSIMGLLFSLIGLVLSIAVVLEKLSNPEVPIGWPSVIVTGLVFAGIQLFMLGLIGEYLGRLFLSANQTPQYVVRKKLGGEEQDES